MLPLLLLWVAQDPSFVSAERMRADLAFLASEPLEGRLSLRRGSEVAIEWIAAELAKAGLKPAAGASFRQDVPLVEYQTDRKQSTLVVERDGQKHTHAYGNEGFTGGFPDDLAIRAPAAFAGYGITAPEFGYDDYRDTDVRGKVVLVFDHEPQENDPRSVFNGVGNTRHAGSRLKALNAQRRGAVALLVVSEPNRKHPSNAERLARIRTDNVRRRVPSQALAEIEVRIPVFTVSDAVAADLLQASGRELQSAIDDTLQPRSMALAGTSIEIRYINSERRRGVSANVIGVLEGNLPGPRTETIVISAHYDHDGTHDGQMYPGADDNGSGTVAVIELARAFGRLPARPSRTLLFAVFAAEERGLLGSYYYVAHPLRPLNQTRAVINFDMIGRNEAPSRQTDGLIEIAADTSNELNLIGTVNSPDYRDIVETENRRVGLQLNYKWDRDAALNIFQRSDQFPFALHDIPAVWWFTGFHPDYHQSTDTVDRINFTKMEKIVRLAYQVGWRFANAGGTPRYVAAPK